MTKTKDELYQENLNCYGDNFDSWPEKVKAQFPDKVRSEFLKSLAELTTLQNKVWTDRIESAMPVEDEPEDPRADPESDVFDPLAVVKGEVKPKRKQSKSKPNKKGK